MRILGKDYTIYTDTKIGGSYVIYQGEKITPAHLTASLMAARQVDWGTLNLVQGVGTSRLSGGTHVKLGVADWSVQGHTKAQVWALCTEMFRAGGLPFPRGFIRDSFQNNKHIHHLFVDAINGAHPAAYQLREFTRARGDGLLGPTAYTGPSDDIEEWRTSYLNPGNRVEFGEARTFTVAAETALLGLDVERRRLYERQAGFLVTGSVRVKRWGRWNILTKHGTFYAEQFLAPVLPTENKK